MKWLSILALLVALPAQGAISLKDWEKKSNADQLSYLGFCVVGLAAEVAKTDPALAFKIKNWYSEKPAGHNYSDGMNALLARILQLEDQAKEGKADLSKFQVEDIVYSVTAEKFKLPSREGPHDAGGFKDAGPPSPPVTAGKQVPFHKVPQEPSDSEKAPAPPISLPAKPIMIGKIDVSHFAGLKSGDTQDRVISLLGQASMDLGAEKYYSGVNVLYADGAVRRVDVFTAELRRLRATVGNDALLDLFDRSDAEAVARLGPPTRRQPPDMKGLYHLFWTFPMPGGTAGESSPDLKSRQTLALEFSPELVGCSRISVTW